jgi:hypothetical protein
MKLTTRVWLSLLLAVFLLAGGGPAAATTMFSDPPEDCFRSAEDLNCNSAIIKGMVLLSSSYAVPWVTQIGSLAPHVQNFTLTAFLPVSSRLHNRESINESMG